MPLAPAPLVIFDCDGVLVDSEMIASRELARYLSDLGRPTTAAECRAAFTGMSIRSVVDFARATWNMNLPDDFAATLRARDQQAFERELRVVDGVCDVLDHLRRRDIAICVASSGTPEKIRHSLKLTGLIHYFGAHLFSASAVARGKPAPDLFAFAAHTMGTAPRHCVVIEDAVPGIQGAVAANMAAVGFTGGAHATADSAKALTAAGADHVVATMPELHIHLQKRFNL